MIGLFFMLWAFPSGGMYFTIRTIVMGLIWGVLWAVASKKVYDVRGVASGGKEFVHAFLFDIVYFIYVVSTVPDMHDKVHMDESTKRRNQHILQKGGWYCPNYWKVNSKQETSCSNCSNMKPNKSTKWRCKNCQYINPKRDTICNECGQLRPKKVKK